MKFDSEAVHLLITEYNQTHDEDIAERIFAHIDPVSRMITAMYENSPTEIDDGIQEARIKIWTVLPRYSGDKTTLQAWLSSIIHNHLIARWRMKHNIDTLPLEDDMVAAEEPEESTLPAMRDALAEYLIKRFPSINSSNLDIIAEITIDALSGGRSAKATIRDIRQQLFPGLRASQVVIVFYSAVFWIRLRNFKPELMDTPPDTEWSLVPELKQVVGQQIGDVLYTLFRGASIHFRIS